MYELHDLVTHFWLKRNIYVAVSVPAGVSGRRRPRAEVTPDHAEASPVATVLAEVVPAVTQNAIHSRTPA